MKLPRELTTVTLLSKTLALILFILLPLLGFLLGFQYQQNVQQLQNIMPNNQAIINNQRTLPNADAILFEKQESWGPCPPGGEPCQQTTLLYTTGRLVLYGNENKEQNLSPELIKTIYSKIEETGIMQKNCDTQPVLDYIATYKITINNTTKNIQSPGCYFELSSIEKIFLH